MSTPVEIQKNPSRFTTFKTILRNAGERVYSPLESLQNIIRTEVAERFESVKSHVSVARSGSSSLANGMVLLGLMVEVGGAISLFAFPDINGNGGVNLGNPLLDTVLILGAVLSIVGIAIGVKSNKIS